MTFATDGLIGARFTATETDARFAIGQRLLGDNGTVWVYVKCALAIGKYDFVTFDDSFNASPLMNANALLGHGIGVAQVAFAVADYGFIAVNGMGLFGNVTLSSQPGQFVAASTLTGRVTTSGTGQVEIQGVTLKTTGGLTATAVLLFMNNPNVDL